MIKKILIINLKDKTDLLLNLFTFEKNRYRIKTIIDFVFVGALYPYVINKFIQPTDCK